MQQEANNAHDDIETNAFYLVRCLPSYTTLYVGCSATTGLHFVTALSLDLPAPHLRFMEDQVFSLTLVTPERRPTQAFGHPKQMLPLGCKGCKGCKGCMALQRSKITKKQTETEGMATDNATSLAHQGHRDPSNLNSRAAPLQKCLTKTSISPTPYMNA